MFVEEVKRQDGIEVVLIVILNGIYYEICKVVFEVGVYVICEKLLFFILVEGQEIKVFVEKKGKIVGVMYGFLGN